MRARLRPSTLPVASAYRRGASCSSWRRKNRRSVVKRLLNYSRNEQLTPRREVATPARAGSFSFRRGRLCRAALVPLVAYASDQLVYVREQLGKALHLLLPRGSKRHVTSVDRE